jgi:uncharacterized membrane protein YgdD (TMEM256/DUF423 family)
MRWFLLLAALFGASALMLDAFFAHGLRSFLGENYNEAISHSLHTASRYQLLMSILMIVLVVFYRLLPSIWLIVSQSFLSLGLIFFCLPIYLKYLFNMPMFSGLAPGGGVLLMAALLALIPLIWA